MTYTPHSITLPVTLIVTARRTEDGECEINEITMNGFHLYPAKLAFIPLPQLRQLRSEWLDANEAAEKHARQLRNQP